MKAKNVSFKANKEALRITSRRHGRKREEHNVPSSDDIVLLVKSEDWDLKNVRYFIERKRFSIAFTKDCTHYPRYGYHIFLFSCETDFRKEWAFDWHMKYVLPSGTWYLEVLQQEKCRTQTQVEICRL